MILYKAAANIKIEPYESLVGEAIKLVEKALGSSVLSGISTIILESVATDHFGKVESDKKDTIFLSLNKIKALGGDHENLVVQIANTIAHELGHIKANFSGGEGPALAEEHKFMEALQHDNTLLEHINLANELDRAGLFKEADYVLTGFAKIASPQEASTGLINIINHMADSVSPEKRRGYKQNIVKKLQTLDFSGLSKKNKNAGAAVGGVISLVKNMLAGTDQYTISQIINQVAGYVK